MEFCLSLNDADSLQENLISLPKIFTSSFSLLNFSTWNIVHNFMRVCFWSISIKKLHSISSSSYSRWRYSPGRALAPATICLQVSQFLAISLHSFIPIFLRFMDTSSSHLILGLPLRLVAYSFPYNIFFGIVVSCILSICPSYLNLWHLINLTMFSPLIMASNSSFCRVLHNSFSFTGPYIIRKVFLSNTANALSSSMVSVHDSES